MPQLTLNASIHGLKTDMQYFNAVWDKAKTFEYRRDDRNFQVGDTLILRETLYSSMEMKMEDKPLEYTGRCIITTITYILRLENGYAILGFNAQINSGG